MSTKGLLLPTQQAMIGNTPAESAHLNSISKSQTQANAVNLLAGGKSSKMRGGDVTVPQVQMLYTPAGGPGTGPNDQIQANSQTSTQMAANSEFDKQATMGGRRRRSRRNKKGGNKNWSWGCMSGGKKRKTTKRNRKSRKSRK
jgi:hypothetical protein